MDEIKLFRQAIRDIQCQQMKKKKKKKSIANTILFCQIRQEKCNLFRMGIPFLNKSDQICKGKSVVEPPNDTTEQMDIVDQKAMGIYFQEEIILDILSRLPVRSLHRFKRVSKSWMTLISDPYFAIKHLNHAKNDQNSQKLLIARRCIGEDDIFSFYSSSLSSVQVVEDEQKLDCPSNCEPKSCRIFCCCDGLVLTEVADSLNKQLLLWNPSSTESIVLPHPESSLDDYVCGLGYDTISDDYKILAINLNASDAQEISVEILALKSGFWRKFGKYPTGIDRPHRSSNCGMDYLALVYGAFHWVGLSQCYTIVSFNISNELYGEIPLLEEMCDPFPISAKRGVSELRGMLCFYCTYGYGPGGLFKLWLMKDYGVEESWTQFLKIDVVDMFCSANPKYMFVDGQVLLRCTHMSSVGPAYRLSRGPFGPWPQCLTIKEGIAYTESLISPRLLI